MNMTLGMFILICIMTVNISNVYIKDYQIIITWLSIKLKVTDIVKYNVYYLPIFAGRGAQICGDNFTLRFIEIQYIDSQKKDNFSIIRISHDDLNIFIKQIENMKFDSSISGYIYPSIAIKNSVMFVAFIMICLLCIYFPDKNINIINGLYAVLAFVVYKIIYKLLNKILYDDYHKNLEKYTIRN